MNAAKTIVLTFGSSSTISLQWGRGMNAAKTIGTALAAWRTAGFNGVAA